jgi:hypothetical protein
VGDGLGGRWKAAEIHVRTALDQLGQQAWLRVRDGGGKGPSEPQALTVLVEVFQWPREVDICTGIEQQPGNVGPSSGDGAFETGSFWLRCS